MTIDKLIYIDRYKYNNRFDRFYNKYCNIFELTERGMRKAIAALNKIPTCTSDRYLVIPQYGKSILQSIYESEIM